MCDPMTMAVSQFVIGAASTVSGYVGQMQEYNKQEQYRQQNIENANQSARDQYNATAMRISQEGDATGVAKQEAARSARAARAKATAAAGEAGVSGYSVDALIKDYYSREGTYSDQLTQQNEWTTDQLVSQYGGIHSQAESRANSIPEPTKPSFLDAGLRILGSGADAFGSYRKLTNPTLVGN